MKNFNDFLDEDVEEIVEGDRQNHQVPMDPPTVLIMRRKSIRSFPGNKRIALYYIDKLDKYISIPYDEMKWAGSAVEEEVIVEDNLKKLQDIVDGHAKKPMKFRDGTQMSVDPTTAKAVLNVHGALNDANKAKLHDMIHKSKHHFGKIVDFAWKNHK